MSRVLIVLIIANGIVLVSNRAAEARTGGWISGASFAGTEIVVTRSVRLVRRNI
ncbi:MAG TPA: hypothetical protein VIM11_13480 [Tepidisphaeraceae bacterium]